MTQRASRRRAEQRERLREQFPAGKYALTLLETPDRVERLTDKQRQALEPGALRAGAEYMVARAHGALEAHEQAAPGRR